MKPQSSAIGLLVTGLVFGLIGHFFFFERFPGIGIPLFIVLLLTAIIGWAIYSQIALSVRRLWLIVPILFFAGMWAFRANETLLFFDALAVLSLGSLFVHYLTREETVDEVSTLEQGSVMVITGLGSATGTIPVLRQSFEALLKVDLEQMGGLKSVLRGLLFALPIVLVFGVLLSSADMVFANKVEGIFGFLLPESLDAIFAHTFVVLFFAWGSTGVLYYALTSRAEWTLSAVLAGETPTEPEKTERDEPAKKRPGLFQINLTESGIILGSVVLLFAAFVFIQFTYLFGGQTIIDDGLTYAQYARRGFFELVTVAVLVLGLILALDYTTVRKRADQHLIFRLLSIVLIAETLVILASAWRRMSLYEVEYGFTHLRLFTHVFMIWLALLLGVAVLSLFRVRKHVFSFGLLLITIGYLGSLNIMNVDQYIATRNIERYHEGHELDICYLTGLSVDALLPLLELYTATTDQNVINQLNWWLDRRQQHLESVYEDDMRFAEYHYSAHQAWETLATLEYRESDGDEWHCTARSR